MLALFLAVASAQTVTVDLPEAATLGEPVVAVVTVTNDRDTPLRIPTDWADGLRVEARHGLPGTRATASLRAGLDAAVDAAALTWKTIGPGGSERAEATAVETASAGTYAVQVWLPARALTGGADDQFLPNAATEGEVEVDPLLEPVPVAFRVERGRIAGGELVLTAVLTAPKEHGVWVPAAWLPQCEAVYHHGRGHTTGSGTRTGAGGQPAVLDEPHLVRLEAGASTEAEVRCGTAPDKAKVVAASLTLVRPSPVVPCLPESPREVLGDDPRAPLWMADLRDLR